MSIKDIEIVKFRVHKQHPYLDAVQSYLPIRVNNDILTACIDLGNKSPYIMINENWFNNLNNQLKELVIIHEYYHYIYDHGTRSEEFSNESHDILNICMDAEINTAIGLNNDNYFNNKSFMKIVSNGEEDYTLPTETSFEEYLEIARKYCNNNNYCISSSNDDSSSRGNNQGNTNNINNKYNKKSLDENIINGSGNSDNNSNNIEQDILNNIIRKQILSEIASHNKCPGDLSQKIKRKLNEIKEDKQDRYLWSMILRKIISKEISMVEQNSDGEYSSYTILNKYYLNMNDGGIIHQGKYEIHQEIHLAVILDVSNSTYDIQDKIISVLSSISSVEEKVIIDVYYVDSEILQVVYGLDNQTKISKRLESYDGGGTNMEVGIDQCLKNNYNHIIVLTDGYTKWDMNRSDKEKSLITIMLFGDEKDILRYSKPPYRYYLVTV